MRHIRLIAGSKSAGQTPQGLMDRPNITAACDECGDIALRPSEVTLLFCRDNTVITYSFICRNCHLIVCKRTDPHLAQILMTMGCIQKVWTLPVEMKEPHSGPKISYDDILDLHIALETTDTLGGVTML